MNTTDRGLDYIAKIQQPDGSFISFSSPSKQPFMPTNTYVTTFAQSIMLSALAHIKNDSALRVRHRLADWLLKQHGPLWSFNYWPREHELSKQLPYPDDLDDTFCALMALFQHNPGLIDATCLGHVAKLLIATETAPGGPYRTWLVPPSSAAVWRDVDVAVNSNIAGFLQSVAGPLPNVTAFMEHAISAEKLTSPYYPSPYPVAYYVARAYRGPGQGQLAKQLLDLARQGFWETPLQTALAVSALVQLGRADACEAALAYLRSSQRSDGSWPAEAFCLDPAQNGRQFYNGSPALTTSLVLEAIARMEQACAEAKPGAEITATTQKVEHRSLSDQVYRRAHTGFAHLPEPLSSACRTMSQSMQKNDSHHEITLLPAFFANALSICPVWANKGRLIRLGEANLYGWMAYTIFDTVIDESDDTQLLPVACTALRRCHAAFWTCLPKNMGFWPVIEEAFDAIDAANAWEIKNCRFEVEGTHITVAALPRYGRRHKLAERSLGHLLTPLALLAAEGYALHSPEVKAVRLGLTHYLIARQLCDDLHDWEQDLQKGQITYVVAMLLRSLRIKPGQHDVRELLARSRRYFWHQAVHPLCAVAGQHLAVARQAFAGSGLFTAKNEFFDLLERLEGGLQKTLDEQAEATAFLKAYAKKD